MTASQWRPDDVVGARLGHQQLRAPFAANAAEVVRNLLAVQAQEFPYARWTVAQRAASATAADVEALVADGIVLRTHILRPTWHFVHRDDLGWLMALSSERLHWGNKGMYRQTGVDGESAGRSAAVLAAAVEGGAHKTREELGAAMEEAGLPGKGLAFVYHLMHAEISRVLVSGTPVRSPGGALKQTYALFSERVPDVGPADLSAEGRDEALGRLVLRYFSSRGPATVKDCAVWSGLTMKDVKRGLQVASALSSGTLSIVRIDDVDYYVDAGFASAANDDRSFSAPDPGAGYPRVDLIQCYDEYVMGYSQSRHYLGGTAPYFPEDNGPMHVVLLDGRLAGWWRHHFAGGGCDVEVRMNRPATPEVQAALEAEVDRYGRFLGMRTRLV
ncbi:winged helix DNA-binding domain-containing protein [Paenarthrobacter sp. YJN-5]|uniref:winged helix DNA-binding domain-containing protein n=1 Tax=Paenarthrobacter sp. YJN-5 TaxID=2735316 RepID=UPI0018783226|nr:winged helix DNA-binding domain-containing protein [Paenarthrobacter sp. YJN-5]QOT17687.1 winged helix DNA-binding domain-containing protein [Paenarthrobacter sp. YJN-5]